MSSAADMALKSKASATSADKLYGEADLIFQQEL